LATEADATVEEMLGEETRNNRRTVGNGVFYEVGPEAIHREPKHSCSQYEYKRLKLGGGQAYDCSNDYGALVA
jgi:hypothetical protein